jgi:hypothetical protein
MAESPKVKLHNLPTLVRRVFWRLRYRVYSRDLYRALRTGRGSKENPLTIEDLQPLMKALRRIE